MTRDLWRPLAWLMLRGSYNEGFMAPSLAALFTSPRWSISAGAGDIDTYRNPLTNEGAYVQRTYFGGNPNLQASESKGKTYGVGAREGGDRWGGDRGGAGGGGGGVGAVGSPQRTAPAWLRRLLVRRDRWYVVWVAWGSYFVFRIS